MALVEAGGWACCGVASHNVTHDVTDSLVTRPSLREMVHVHVNAWTYHTQAPSVGDGLLGWQLQRVAGKNLIWWR